MRRRVALVAAAASLLGACSNTSVPVVAPSGERLGVFHLLAYPGAHEQLIGWTATLTNDPSTTWCVQQVAIGGEQLSLPQPACTALPASGHASAVLALGTSTQGEAYAFYAPGLLQLGSGSGPISDATSGSMLSAEDRGFHLVLVAGDMGSVTITMGTRDRSHVDTVLIPGP